MESLEEQSGEMGKALWNDLWNILYPLVLSCDKPTELEREKSTLNPEASVRRPKRDSAVAAELRVKGIVEAEED